VTTTPSSAANLPSCGESGCIAGSGPALRCRSCGCCACLCSSISTSPMRTLQALPPSISNALQNLMLSGANVRLEQNGLGRRHSRSSERAGRGLRWVPSSLCGRSSISWCGSCAGSDVGSGPGHSRRCYSVSRALTVWSCGVPGGNGVQLPSQWAIVGGLLGRELGTTGHRHRNRELPTMLGRSEP
jgi:hypothetical protein